MPPPGESPFRVKGVLFHGTVSFFEHNHLGGFVALVDAAEDDETKRFLRQNFLAGGTYDVMRVPSLIELEARVMRLELARYLERRTRWQAERDVTGVYRMLLKLASPEMAIVRLPRVITQMFNFGRPLIEPLGPHHYRIDVAGIPTALVYWLHYGFAIYTETVLASAGAKRPIVQRLSSVPEDPAAGLPMSTLRFEVRWEA